MNRDLSLPPQRVLFASGVIPELHGCSETAEFIATLPRALSESGHDVRLIVPAYTPMLARTNDHIQVSRVRLPGTHREARILRGQTEQNGILYLVDIPGNPGQSGDQVLSDAVHCGLFSRIVALVAINQAGINWQPDLLHCAGWQSALAISLLAGEWSRPATIYSMHEANHHYCQNEHIKALSLPVELLKSGALEMGGQFSFEKGAILTADELLLPSDGYRHELLLNPDAHPLAPLLKERADRLASIPSSIDYQRWSPTTDPHLEQHYDSSSFELKKLNRQRLLGELGLQLEDRDLLISFLATDHNGADSEQILGLLESLAPDTPVHILAAGRGADPLLQPLLDNVERFPRLSVHTLDDSGGWHRMLAGSDCLLLPAPYYPSAQQAQCALGYGTVPIAHATASIDEAVTDATPANLLHGTANGFLYADATVGELTDAVMRASKLYAKPPIWWEKLAVQGMEQNFQVRDSLTAYLQCYQSAIDNPATTPVH
ncbi:glycogen synthase [Sedimenticola thiotaurini]|uniref:starch synthase n=1 Tax=Sedimenticola thiotaurini TaxID=1543721 RepID=A0A0F7JX61_9GAMM|nr:glycogen/starch synthase [Sedimenticola thiotaurini]AKH19380.1 hypothetical protein AAY24_02360 [Sedimenticola thiotaurini]